MRLAAVVVVVAAIAVLGAAGCGRQPLPCGAAGQIKASGLPIRTAQGLALGVNFTHFSDNCCRSHRDALTGTGIIDGYGDARVAAIVDRDLMAMRVNGITTLRLVLWHQTDASGLRWGVVSSRGGHLVPTDKQSLVRYLGAVRRAGFAALTVAFAPMDGNDPASASYRASALNENWGLIASVRALVKRYGPPLTRIDLLAEGTPDPYDPAAVANVRRYIAIIYRRYVRAYGNADVTVSAIASQAPADIRLRLANLIAALRASGEPLPRWFDVHIGFGQPPLHNLDVVEQVLERDRLRLPLILGEVPYEDSATAAAIASYRNKYHRRILEVLEWPLSSDRPCTNVSVSPPYTIRAYAKALRR